MLRKIRIVAAVLFFLLITLLFLDFTGTLHAWFGWMAKIQFLPALLAVNVGVVLALVALTLLFGRVYCSVICPLGVMQDIVSWFAGRRKKHRYRFSYSPALTWLRWTMLAVFVAAMLAGVGWLIAPYSAYGRIESFRTDLCVGQQRVGVDRRADGQLRFLFGGGVDEEPRDVPHRRRDVHRTLLPRLAQRTHVVQHGLPAGHAAGRVVPPLAVPAAFRRVEMQRLQTLRPQLQGVVHRPGEPYD